MGGWVRSGTSDPAGRRRIPGMGPGGRRPASSRARLGTTSSPSPVQTKSIQGKLFRSWAPIVRVLEQAREGQGSGVLLEGGREADRAVSPPVPGPEAFLEERARRREVALESGEVLEAEALEGNQHLLDVALGFPLGPREQAVGEDPFAEVRPAQIGRVAVVTLQADPLGEIQVEVDDPAGDGRLGQLRLEQRQGERGRVNVPKRHCNERDLARRREGPLRPRWSWNDARTHGLARVIMTARR